MVKTVPANRIKNVPNINGKQKSKKKVKRLKSNTIQSFFASTQGGHNLKLTENIYNCLNVEPAQKSKQQQPKENKLNKPPPLILTDKSCNINKILTENGVAKFNFKIMSIGTKVFLENDNDFNKICIYLKQNNVEHFSYTPKDKKVYKVVLSGLPEIPTETIQEELATLNIQPELIIQMKTRNPNPHRALYLLHFNGKDITLQNLQKIKAISHTIVKWSSFKPKIGGPTQCRNCTMYGHGTRNCHRRPSCTLCASNDHNQTNCPLNKLPPESSPLYKCSYCVANNYQSTNHRANDPNCPAKNVYLESRKNITTRQRNKPSNQRQNQQKTTIPAPIPPPLTQSFRDVVTRDEKPKMDTSTTNEDLFSTTELLQIFTNTIHQIRQCRTKLDQIQVITSLLNHVL